MDKLNDIFTAPERQDIARKAPLPVLTITAVMAVWSVLAGGLFNIAARELFGEPLQLETPSWAIFVQLLVVVLLLMKPLPLRTTFACLLVPISLLFITGTGLGDSALFMMAVFATPVTIVLARKHKW